MSPPGTTPTTMIILEGISRIWAKIGMGEMEIKVSREDFQYYWKRVKEKTALSFSGLHFRHYKAIVHSDILSRMHALKLPPLQNGVGTQQVGQWFVCHDETDCRGCPGLKTESHPADESRLKRPQQTNI